MKIAVVCPYDLAIPGGVQMVAAELASRLNEDGDEAVLIGPGRGEGWISVGRSVSVRANRSRAPICLAPGSWSRVQRALEGSDVVHVHEPLVPLVGSAALASGFPVVATFHADPSRLVRLLYRSGSRVMPGLSRTIITAVSPVAASAIPTGWGVPAMIPNGVDIASYAPSTFKEPGLVAFLGRDDRRKGFDVLTRAWPAVVAAVPDARLVVAGLQRRFAPPAITYLGRVSELEKRQLLARASVMVAPNLGGESFGVVVVEGMAAGCAVVASDLPAFRGVAGGAAEFVTPGDHRALADCIIALLIDPSGLQARSTAATAKASAYDWGAVVGSYRKLYRRAVESG